MGRYNDYDTQLFLNFQYVTQYDVLEYGVIFSPDYEDPTFENSYYARWNGNPLGTVSVSFINPPLQYYPIGSCYCKMYIRTSSGYFYSSVVNDSYVN